MKTLAFGPSLITLYLLIKVFSARAARRGPEWKNAVYLPSLLLWVGLLANIFVLPSTLVLWQEDRTKLWFTALCLVGWSMELAYANCWVRFNEQGFIHHTFFGRTHEFTYEDLTGIRRSGFGDIRLYCRKHLIFFDSECLNLDTFMRQVDRKSNHLQELPKRVKWDPYYNNAVNGKANFFVSLITCIGLGAIMIFAAFAVFGPPESEESTVRCEAVFQSWREQKGATYFLAEDGTEYALSLYGDLTVDPEPLCDGRTVYTLWIREHSTRWIEQMEGPEGMLFTFAEKQDAYKGSQIRPLVYLGLMWLATLFFLLFSLRVGRHPERYSDRTWRLFVSQFPRALPNRHSAAKKKHHGKRR